MARKTQMTIPDDLQSVALNEKPHVVILGAGASRAATPAGEINRRTLPLMRELPAALNLEDVLEPNQIEAAEKDFEEFFSTLPENAVHTR